MTASYKWKHCNALEQIPLECCFDFQAVLKLIKEQGRTESLHPATFLDLQLLITVALITGALHLIELLSDGTTAVERSAANLEGKFTSIGRGNI